MASRAQEIKERNERVMRALGVYGGRNHWDEPAWCAGCPCGCGEMTDCWPKTGLYKFRPGHDAKLASKALRAIRDDNAPVTAAEVVDTLHDQEFDGIERKVRTQLMYFPKNSPTRKAARAMLERCGTNGSGQSLVRMWCQDRRHGEDDYKMRRLLRDPSYHVHETAEDCAVSAVLEGTTASQILFALS